MLEPNESTGSINLKSYLVIIYLFSLVSGNLLSLQDTPDNKVSLPLFAHLFHLFIHVHIQTHRVL